jgi:DNA mismatch endonuclease (patch repair protein)
MADVVTPEVRSRMMSGIKGKNTKPEIILRKGLHKEGFRFRIHAGLPGRPDIVFPKWRAVVFVHGCFWHGHGCHLFKWPQSRVDFWRSKLSGNIERDKSNIQKLRADGWRVGIVWECALKGKNRRNPGDIVAHCSKWLKGNRKYFELAGKNETGTSFRLL